MQRHLPSSRGDAPAAPGAAALWRDAVRRAARERWGDPWGYLFILPAVAMFLVFNAWPILRGLTIAFQDYRFLIPGHAPFNGLDNFVELAQDPTFRAALGRSLYYVALYVPLMVAIPLAVANLIAAIWRPWLAGAYRSISYLPVILPIAVAMLLWRHLYNGQFGYLNVLIAAALGPGKAPGWTSDPAWVMPAMVVAAVWKNAGYNVLLFLIGLYAIPSALYEAAAIDGAGPWRRFRAITLPLLKPVFALVLVLSAGAVSVLQEPYIWYPSTSGPAGPQNAALTAGYYAYKVAFLYGDLRWGYGAAINLVLGLLATAAAVVVFRVFRAERLM